VESIRLARAQGAYTAVAYCAGDPRDTPPIQANGYVFNAFANLARAITEIVHNRLHDHGDEELLLWIDQVCINQSDATERSHQVSFMGDIYRSARDVAVCLSTDGRPRQAMEWMKELYEDKALPGLSHLVTILENRMSRAHLSYEDVAFTTQEWQNIYRTRNAVEQVIKSNADHKNKAFMNGRDDAVRLAQQPWWTRAWTFQEYVSSNDPFFLYGGQAISWKILSVVLPCVINAEFWLRPDDDHLKRLLFVWVVSCGPSILLLSINLLILDADL
jgi:hypothetical protein